MNESDLKAALISTATTAEKALERLQRAEAVIADLRLVIVGMGSLEKAIALLDQYDAGRPS